MIQIRDLKKQIADRLTKSPDATLKTSGDQLTHRASAASKRMSIRCATQAGEDPLNFPIKTNNRLASLLRVVTVGRRDADRQRRSDLLDLKVELKGEMDRLQKILNVDLPTFNALLKKLGLDPVVAGKPLVF